MVLAFAVVAAIGLLLEGAIAAATRLGRPPGRT